jgi:hypothetical protein
MGDLTPTMYEALAEVGTRYLARNHREGQRMDRWTPPVDGAVKRSCEALVRRGLLEIKRYPSEDRRPGATPCLGLVPMVWEPYYLINDAGWEVLVVHRGWRTFEPNGDGGYVLTAPDSSVIATLVPGEKNGRRYGWKLPDGRTAPRLLTARSWLLEARRELV